MPPADAREKETSDSVDNELDLSLPTTSASTDDQKSDEQIQDKGNNVDDEMEAEGDQEDQEEHAADKTAISDQNCDEQDKSEELDNEEPQTAPDSPD